jgi:hypothetical protein
LPFLDTGESGIEPLVLHAEAFVVNAKVVKHGSVEVIDVNRISCGGIGIVVRRTIMEAPLDPRG